MRPVMAAKVSEAQLQRLRSHGSQVLRELREQLLRERT